MRKIDKHSTGGVGDKTSLILGPIVAAAGIAVPMISGRGLGHTGGTLDKLESIPGFVARLPEEKFKSMVEKLGLCFMGQTDKICPADKKIYSLRDVTGTIESVPLICASIMSKKLAEGIDALVLDVKFGSGAFMKTLEKAEDLAKRLVDIGTRAGKNTRALLTGMKQPLGKFVGNSLEVSECLAILRGEKEAEFEDTRELSLELAAHMLELGGKAKSILEARALAETLITSGRAMEKFEEVCRAHGGDLKSLPRPPAQETLTARNSGFLYSYDVEQVGLASLSLGAGRKAASDKIDPVAGIKIHRKIGHSVTRGEPLFTLFAGDSSKFAGAQDRLFKAVSIREEKPAKSALIAKIL